MRVIGTAGHVDHGKSSLVLALTGTDPDRLVEEKIRGMTIDLGFAWMFIEGYGEVAIIDVPGHNRFIKNMLAGVGGINMCLFVVAADEGWMPQSQEHLDILHLLGLQYGVVALTKADLVDRETIEIATEEIRERLANTTLANSPIVPVSSVTGSGLADLRVAIAATLRCVPAAEDRGRPQLWIDRVFTVAGAGVVVTGTLIGGPLNVGESVLILPQQIRARIRGIQSHHRPVTRIGPGNRVAINLAGVERADVTRGSVLVVEGQWQLTNQIGCELEAIPDLDHELTERGAYHFHIGTAEVPAKVRLAGGVLPPGGRTVGRIELATPLPLTFGDRFILRDVGRRRTVAGGRVLDVVFAKTVRQGWAVTVKDLQTRATLDRDGLLRHLVVFKGWTSPSQLAQEVGLALPELHRKLERFAAEDLVTLFPDVVVSRSLWRTLENCVIQTLAQFHRSHRLEIGMQRSALVKELAADPALADRVLTSMVEEGKLVVRGSLLALADHRITLDEAERRSRDALLQLLEAHRFQPPTIQELEAQGWSATFVKALVATGDLEQLDTEFVLPPSLVRLAVEILSAVIEERGPMSVADARDALGSSRKYVMPLLYYLDRKEYTRRIGDLRIMTAKGKELARQKDIAHSYPDKTS